MSADDALLTFRVGDRRLAVAASEVAEVVRRPRVTRVPHAPRALAGVASLRGQVLPVVALDAVLGTAGEAGAAARLVVLDGAPPLGLAVDEVTGLAGGDATPGALLVREAPRPASCLSKACCRRSSPALPARARRPGRRTRPWRPGPRRRRPTWLC
ncbi:chemotaxis protein CheW [Phenylobacterium sp. J426]|uniref:chemotaxis protein CheW n=1 Tax=Phenylobacterium sp. J426 TaxID=2898439 RepID=UPI0035AE2CE1